MFLRYSVVYFKSVLEDLRDDLRGPDDLRRSVRHVRSAGELLAAHGERRVWEKCAEIALRITYVHGFS